MSLPVPGALVNTRLTGWVIDRIDPEDLPGGFAVGEVVGDAEAPGQLSRAAAEMLQLGSVRR